MIIIQVIRSDYWGRNFSCIRIRKFDFFSEQVIKTYLKLKPSTASNRKSNNGSKTLTENPTILFAQNKFNLPTLLLLEYTASEYDNII